LQICRLPPRAAVFYVRALRLARKADDEWSLISATAPHHLLLLLRLARGRRRVVELGTGSAWGTVVLALGDPRRSVRSFDPFDLGGRERYLALAGAARKRITLYPRPGAEPDGESADFVFIDSSHGYEDTVSEFRAWLPHLEPRAIVVFHDYESFEVARAIDSLALDGKNVKGVYVWTATQSGDFVNR
jgi:predicted O-methyltransferase YrrM